MSESWFKVDCNILDDPKLGQLGGDECWGFMRLLAFLKREGSTDGVIRLDDRGLKYVTRRHQTRHARAMVALWASKGLLRTSLDGPYTVLTCSKWPERQGRGLQTRLDKTRQDKPIRSRPPSATTKLDSPDHLEEKHPLVSSTMISHSDKPPEGKNVQGLQGLQNVHTPAVQSPPAQSPTGMPKGKPPSPKRATQCPEDLTPEQWQRIIQWRNGRKNRPDLTDAELKAQWEIHSLHHRTKENTAKDWVLSFYKWLLSAFYKPLAGGGKQPPRPQPAAFKADHRPRPPKMSAAELAAMAEENAALREQTGLRPRRARHAEAPGAVPPTGPEDGGYHS